MLHRSIELRRRKTVVVNAALHLESISNILVYATRNGTLMRLARTFVSELTGEQ